MENSSPVLRPRWRPLDVPEIPPIRVKTCLHKEPDLVLFENSRPERLHSDVLGSRLMETFLRRLKLWCLNRASTRGFGRIAARLACLNTKPYHLRAHLADMTRRGFVDPSAALSHPDIRFGDHVYLGVGVNIARSDNGGAVILGDKVQIYGNSFLETGSSARISIGARTHIQPGCHLHAHVSNIEIGECVEIAANCGFFSYDHGVELGKLIMEQPLGSKGDIRIGDGAWLGYGVTVLQGVNIGAGAVIGAGSVVSRDIPENAIAAGVPAKVIKYRTAETA